MRTARRGPGVGRKFPPIGTEVKFAVRVSEAVQIMGIFKCRLVIEPTHGVETIRAGQAGGTQCLGQYFVARHVEAGVRRADPFGDLADNEVVVARLARRLDDLGAKLNMRVAAALIEIAMLQKRRRRQDDIGHLGGIGEELFMHASK